MRSTFLPFRSGPQSDPPSGQFPNIQAPSVSVADPASRSRDAGEGRRAARSCSARTPRTTSASGGRVLRRRDAHRGTLSPPYLHVRSRRRAVRARELTAVAEDASARPRRRRHLTVTGPDACKTTPPPSPPPAARCPRPQHDPQAGTTVTVAPTPARAWRRSSSSSGRAPCAPPPRRRTAADRPARRRTSGCSRCAPSSPTTPAARRRSTARSSSAVRRARRHRRRAQAVEATASAGRSPRRVVPPAGMSAAAAVRRRQPHVRDLAPRGARSSTGRSELRSNCTARLRFTAKRTGKSIHKVSARFGGNTVLYPASSSRRFS